ncbi:hypothetical protein E2C01_072891 [Portunus trituberculatus]|uniref:Uncharacterized protein n=1 Tax=Portunus trituberculatus TaxID=210409 RepID=A0A5B7I8D6_PORTR|nr:hypothetical protein [Portunus trituberculatus]
MTPIHEADLLSLLSFKATDNINNLSSSPSSSSSSSFSTSGSVKTSSLHHSKCLASHRARCEQTHGNHSAVSCFLPILCCIVLSRLM